MRSLLSSDGPLARSMRQYRERAAQLQMAEAVAERLANGGHLVCEAPTGTGKSLAYLLPAATSKRRVVISTATRALQSQLLRDDLPQVAIALGRPVRVELLKGRSNYLCRLLADDVASRVLDERHGAALERLRPWLISTTTGDRAELDHSPPAELWSELAVGADGCRGPRCPLVSECFCEHARDRAADADIVLVNHALYFADLGLRLASDGLVGVLPEHDVAIFDEAHALEDAAAEWLGLRLGGADLARLCRDAERACERDRQEPPAWVLHRIERHGAEVLGALPGGAGRIRLRPADLERLPEASVKALGEGLGTLAAVLEGAGEECDLVARRAARLSASFDGVMRADPAETVVWSERTGPDVRLRSAPIDIAETLRRGLWDGLHAAVLTSATLAIDDDLHFVRRRLGLDDAHQLVLGSELDYREQALLYVPVDAPDPRQPDWVRRLADHLIAVVEASRGRALCLFTSYRALEATYALAAPRLQRFGTFRQGDAPRERLIERFRRDVDSVLFATTSFWQGVDVRGEACSCVTIDRLPFASPAEPLFEARCERIAADGGSPFTDYAVPSAALMLKQGFGRLLRSDSDRGVVAVLDGRLRSARYAEALLEALPPARRVERIEDVAAFFAIVREPAGS